MNPLNMTTRIYTVTNLLGIQKLVEVIWKKNRISIIIIIIIIIHKQQYNE